MDKEFGGVKVAFQMLGLLPGKVPVVADVTMFDHNGLEIADEGAPGFYRGFRGRKAEDGKGLMQDVEAEFLAEGAGVGEVVVEPTGVATGAGADEVVGEDEGMDEGADEV